MYLLPMCSSISPTGATMNPRTLLYVAVAAVAVQVASAIFGATTIAFTTGTTALTGATYSVAGSVEPLQNFLKKELNLIQSLANVVCYTIHN